MSLLPPGDHPMHGCIPGSGTLRSDIKTYLNLLTCLLALSGVIHDAIYGVVRAAASRPSAT